MGLKDLLFGKKDDQELIRQMIWEYVDAQIDPLMSTWISMQDELEDFTEVERKDLLRDEFSKMNRGATEFLKGQKIKPPPHLFQLVREAINEKTMERIKPHLSQFVYSYRRPHIQWPHDTDIPIKDLEKLKAALLDNNVSLEMLNYDISDEKIRSLLIQYEIRKKPDFQNAESWSKNFSYSHDDLILLSEVLKARNVKVQGVDHVTGDLWILVKQEMLRQQDEQFARSFRAANPNLPAVPTKVDWAMAYFKALKSDLDFMGYVERMARLNGTIFEKNELQTMVKDILSGNIPRPSPGKR